MARRYRQREGSPYFRLAPFPGFDKYFSRFLYLRPEEVEKDLVASNRRLTRSELAEICGDASFNADLHPPLLPEEIAYPTAKGGSAREQISVSDLAVEPDPRRPFRVRLVNVTTSRTVVPVDLGFRNPRMRPLLFQMLSRPCPKPCSQVATGGRARPVISTGSGDGARNSTCRRRSSFASSPHRPERYRASAITSPSPSRSTSEIPCWSICSAGWRSLETFQVILEERLPGRDHLIPCGEDRFVTEMILQLDPGTGCDLLSGGDVMEPPHTQGRPLPGPRCPNQASLGRERGALPVGQATMSENHGSGGSIPPLGTAKHSSTET
jgi:hypothetical protein